MSEPEQTALFLDNEWDTSPGNKPILVEEIQGPYGPLTIPETLLQKIWLRRDYDGTALTLSDGRKLSIIEAGSWNLQEGPDFRNAVIDLAGQRLVGDVEIHFYATDWQAHNHGEDPQFRNVILHVTLFPANSSIDRGDGYPLPNLALLPYLNTDLESYANDEALLTLEKRDALDLIKPLLQHNTQQRRDLIREKAHQRYRQKLEVARERHRQLGWEEACHQACMEALGYRRNRDTMLKLAKMHPLQQLASEVRSDPLHTAEQLLNQASGHWKLAGLRPANHPHQRLKQYCLLVSKQAHWPRQLGTLLSGLNLPCVEASTQVYRRHSDLSRFRKRTKDEVLCGTIGGTRLNTLLGDALLPLWAADTGRDAFGPWFHGFPGDYPEVLGGFLKQAGIVEGKQWPMSHGWVQGALQVLIEGGF